MRNSQSRYPGTRNALPPVKHRGLTLVELLVAISVLGFVAIIGWRGLDGIVRARIALNSDLEQTRGMQLAFAQLQSDCAHLANNSILPDRLPLALEQGRLILGGIKAGLSAELPLALEQGRLILIRTVFADNQPSRLQVITYRVRDGMLTRRESAATRDLRELDMLWRSAANDTDTTEAVTLRSDVTAMEMRLWFSGGWRSGADTLMPASTAEPAKSPLQPTGLEVTLRLRGQDTGLFKIFLLGAV